MVLVNDLVAAPSSHRWLARIIDMALWSPFAYTLQVLCLIGLNEIIGVSLNDQPRPSAFMFVFSSILFLLYLMLIDTVAGAVFGNTPGKALLHIQVTEQDGKAMSLGRRLKRNLGVGVFGLGLSVPILNWVAMLSQYIKTKDGGTSTYDKALGFSVVKTKDVNTVRGVACAVLFLFSYSLQALSVSAANEVANKHGWCIGMAAISKSVDQSVQEINQK
jgi:uncharacterized RDD family membrane protein YckC